MAGKYKAAAIRTNYWMPGEDYIAHVVRAINNAVENGDYVTISEKALSTALRNLIDEKTIQPSWLAVFLAKYWMRIFWPYILGPLCHLKDKTIRFLRSYPPKEGSLHKQVALLHGGLLQALMFGSEGAIDGSNLPGSLVALPLEDSHDIAQKLRKQIESELGKKVTVVIVDTDKTYSLRGFHFTPRPKPLKGINSCGGFIAYLAGRLFKLERRATPLAVVGSKLSIEKALEIAKIANRTRGTGAGKTVWDMAITFKVRLTEVTWNMLRSVEHRPIVIIRFKRK